MKRWTVSEITTYIRQMFEIDSRLQDVEIIGEVSNLRVPRSGHAYFTLKDADAQLKCVIWNYARRPASAYQISDGEKIVGRGYMGVYEAGGVYQMICRRVEPAGRGDLHAQFEALKVRLQEQGLFEREEKLPLSEAPRTIGIVTSESTAALQDVLNVLGRRNPMLRAVLSPASVQGEKAPPQIIAALRRLELIPDLDAVLVVRGGGSIEDLWCFNDEQVVRTIADMTTRIPVITGVGHEIDFTLVDFAASQRAPTPSAAAELVTPVTVDDYRTRLELLARRMRDAYEYAIISRQQAVDWQAMALRQQAPQIDQARQRIDALLERSDRAISRLIERRRDKLDALSAELRAVSPQATLARGYAIVYGSDGAVLRRAADVSDGEQLTIQLSDGTITAQHKEDN